MPNDEPKLAASGQSLTTRPRKPKGTYLVNERRRNVSTLPVTTTELLTLSALNPIAAALFGWGISVAPTTASTVLGVPVNGMTVFGAILQVVAWSQIFLMWRQSGD